MKQITSLRPQEGDLALVCDAMNCVAYALSIASDSSASVDWTVGSISGDTPLPIKALLAGTLTLDVGRVRAHLDRLLEGNRSQLEMFWRGEGTALLIRETALPEFDRHGRVTRIVGTVQDVSGEVWDSRGPESEAWNERIYDHLDLGVSWWSDDRKLIFANRQFRELHQRFSAVVRPGISAQSLLTLVAQSEEIVNEDSPREWVRRALLDFRTERSRELALKDGRWLEVTAIRFPAGTIVRTLDITSQKGGERALRQAKEIAESANLKKSRFLRAANHDLRQPLATLKILIYSSFGVENETKLSELLHTMDVTVGIMDEILGSLLQIGQLDAGRIVAKVSHFQMTQVLDRLKIEFAPQAEAKGLKLRVVSSYETVLSDRSLLERILGNLISNAIRFTETGTILIGPRHRSSGLEIQVWDTGCGVAEDQLDLIFEEFQQVGEQNQGRQRGLGLGLNIALRLAQLLDHPIRARSSIGRGSVFSVAVPFGNIWQSDLGEPEISERIGGEFLGVKMLFVEDNEMLRNTVSSMLEKWGVNVTKASDASLALRLFLESEHAFDLALVDYRLPSGRAGTDILRELRNISERNLPGIVTTADNDPELINRIREEGLPVLIKPINPVRLRSVMHHLLYEQDRTHLTEKTDK